MIRALALVAALAAAVPAAAERRIDPYLEVDQTVFFGDGDVLTYTTLAAGIDASVSTRRSQGQISYRYEHRVGWNGNQGDADLHSGLARGRTWLVPNLVQLDGGALVTRTRTDVRGFSSTPALDLDSSSTLYSVFAGPTLGTRLGGLDFGAAYRFGYTKLDSETRGFGGFDESTSHVATASVGMRSGRLPFGWTLSSGYEREDASQLDQRFESAVARLDIVVPLTPTLAAVGGVGYENIEASQRDALRDANGIPVLDGDGRFVTDPASPRRLSYDQDGFIWDAGVSWRPSRRTQLEVRIGRRYGSMTYIGSFSYVPNERHALRVGVYDGIQTFGRQLNDGLALLPTQFTVARNPFDASIGGCVYGTAGAAGACLDDALQSIATGVYRSRGANAVWSYRNGAWTGGVGAGYARRQFFSPQGAFATDGAVDENYYVQGFAGRSLDERSGIEANVYANWFDSGFALSPTVFAAGATGSYYRNFTPRLSGRASLGVYTSEIDGFDSDIVGAARVGARYTF